MTDKDPESPDAASGTPELSSDSNRRGEVRRRPFEVPWLRSARVKYGPAVHLLDVSRNGIRFRSDQDLNTNTNLVLELVGADRTVLVPARVVRSRRIVSGSFVWYEIGCRTKRPHALGDLLGSTSERGPGSTRPLKKESE